MRKYFVCDLETTGTSPLNVEMVEFYMGHFEDEKLLKELHIYIRPRCWAKEADEAVRFHGITKEKALQGLPWKFAMKQIWDFLPDDPSSFVCHANRRMFGRSGCYDWLVLSSHFLDIGFEHYLHFQRVFPAFKIVSTHSLAQMMLRGRKNDLKSVCHALGVPLTNQHTAKNDANATWQTFLKLSHGLDLDEFCEEDFYQLNITPKIARGSLQV